MNAAATQNFPDDYCVVCQGELWGAEANPDRFGHVICPECRQAALQAYNRQQDGGEVA